MQQMIRVMQLNRAQKEVQKAHLEQEAKTIQELKQVYRQAKKDCEEKIRALSSRTDMENLQTIIYQKQYQEALKKQLEGILDNLAANEFTSITDYLGKSYYDAYAGVMYDLYKQRIPIITPIRQEQVVKALQVDSKLSQGLYKRLGEDVAQLKKSIQAELSRGIAGGLSWNQMAEGIAKGMNSPFRKAYNKALRISRTEGHRIQQQSALDAQKSAKEKGADVVKQWDATLDDKTRPTHQALDGQIREVEEDFTVGSMSVPYPGGFTDPAEDCNCRCVITQRAKWALGEEELKILQERAKFYGLDKTKDFEKFKEKYFDAVNQLQESGGEDIIRTVAIVQNFDEMERYLSDTYNITLDTAVKSLNFEICKDVINGIETIMNEYPELAEQIAKITTSETGVMCCSGKHISFNPAYFQDTREFREMCEKNSGAGWWIPNSSSASIGVHETAHAVEQLLIDANETYLYSHEKILAWNDCTEAKAVVSRACKNIKKTPYGKGKVNETLKGAISGYAKTSPSETMAEAFADVYANGDKANPLSQEIVKLTKEKLNSYKGV